MANGKLTELCSASNLLVSPLLSQATADGLATAPDPMALVATHANQV